MLFNLIEINLLPEEIKTVSSKCAEKTSFSYRDVKVSTSPHDGLVDVTFTYAGATLRVKNAIWQSLVGFFAE